MEINKNLNTHNQNIINKILNNANVSNNKSLFLILINGIKDDYNLCLLMNNNILEESINLLYFVEDKFERAQIINAILNIMYDIKYDYINNRNLISNILELYLENISNGYNVFENIKDSIFLFSELGIEFEYIFEKCVKRYSKDFCIDIFSRMNLNLNNDCINKHFNLISSINKNRKLHIRFDLVLHFYLMTNLQYIDNINIIGNYLNKFNNYTSICSDWVFSSKMFNHNYVLNNVITKEEEEIFISIGDIYNKCKNNTILSNTEEELFDYLYIASDNFRLSLTSKKVQDLVNQFIKGRTFFQVVFEIPVNN